MDKKALYIILQKYLDHSCSNEERKMVEDWLELLHDDKIFLSYSNSDIEAIQNRIWDKIQEETNIPKVDYSLQSLVPSKEKQSLVVTLTKWAVAASIIAIAAVAAFKFTKNKSAGNTETFASIIPKTGIITQTNNGTDPMNLLLEDSTKIVLQPGTTLNYPNHFKGEKREVYLEGEAFFDVSKNAKRPFYIYHNRLVTHVIGTSFIINTKRHDNQAEVSVITGRVEVSENNQLVNGIKNKQGNGVVLTPNQKVVYAETARTFVASIVDKPIPVTTLSPQIFEFADEEMVHVLSAISKEYAVEIVVENENINKCTFTGKLGKRDLYSKLDAICKAVDATYELKGTKILIKGAGCE